MSFIGGSTAKNYTTVNENTLTNNQGFQEVAGPAAAASGGSMVVLTQNQLDLGAIDKAFNFAGGANQEAIDLAKTAVTANSQNASDFLHAVQQSSTQFEQNLAAFATQQGQNLQAFAQSQSTNNDERLLTIVKWVAGALAVAYVASKWRGSKS